ncbi:MAG: VWA domain-containing protein [Gammaproteobacteria bacterium]|nr:VWA domain-containing protein [Gammaproteobacteria bacterium]NNK99228.1 VWA domain-containing protein [Xanthomonadales bacterium]
MDLLAPLQQFHFLRPAWLLLLIPAGILIWSVYQRNDSLRSWRKIVKPHLLEHLLMREGGQEGRWRPVYLLGIGWLVGILALAGPSWQKQDSPFSEDLAAMFIVVKVTPQMQAADIQPNRLQRSVIKIHDLLALKQDIRTGLIAYAGSAHLVMPLTSDAGIINNFAAALEPDIMPVKGDEPAEAIALASQRLKKAGVPGSIVLITDAVDVSQSEELKRIYTEDKTEVHILAMAAGPEVIPPPGSYPAPPLDLDSLNLAARAMGGSLTVVSNDKSDVESLSAKVERSISRVASQEGQQWRDSGYYLLIVLALILLFFFRQGGSVSAE